MQAMKPINILSGKCNLLRITKRVLYICVYRRSVRFHRLLDVPSFAPIKLYPATLLLNEGLMLC